MKTLQEAIAGFHPAVLAKYDFSEAIYAGTSVRMEKVKCPTHGYFSQYAGQFRKNGAGCPTCGNELRTANMTSTEKDYVQRVQELHAGKDYDYSRIGFTKMNAKITVSCPAHGAFTVCANHHLYRAQGCPSCATEGRKKRAPQIRHLTAAAKVNNTAEHFFQDCAVAHDGRYSYPEQTYMGAKHKIRIVCPTHGEFTQSAWAHLSGKGCRRCGHRSKGEDALALFLSQYTVVERGRRDLLGGHLEIDCWLPEYGVGVEYHGLYHHVESKKGGIHRHKWELAQQAGIRLIQVFEDEWQDMPDIVKARLLAALGKAEKRDARKLDVKVCPWGEAKQFLDSTHIQKCGAVGTAFGLYEGMQLVAVATFGRSRSGAMAGAQKDGEYEVLRYASIGRVRGGFTRLFTAFIRKTNPKKVISYCDLRYGTGGVYEKAGFTMEAITGPDYWWVPTGKVMRIPRYATQKHKLANPDNPLHKFYAPDKTESQICHDAGLERILGVGSQRWVWTS